MGSFVCDTPFSICKRLFGRYGVLGGFGCDNFLIHSKKQQISLLVHEVQEYTKNQVQYIGRQAPILVHVHVTMRIDWLYSVLRPILEYFPYTVTITIALKGLCLALTVFSRDGSSSCYNYRGLIVTRIPQGCTCTCIYIYIPCIYIEPFSDWIRVVFYQGISKSQNHVHVHK